MSENPDAERLVSQQVRLRRLSFRIARGIMEAEVPHMGEVALERYMAYLPVLASEIYSCLLGDSAFAVQASQSNKEDRSRGVEAIIDEARKAAERL
jgi:hypothetical protein